MEFAPFAARGIGMRLPQIRILDTVIDSSQKRGAAPKTHGSGGNCAEYAKNTKEQIQKMITFFLEKRHVFPFKKFHNYNKLK